MLSKKRRRRASCTPFSPWRLATASPLTALYACLCAVFVCSALVLPTSSVPAPDSAASDDLDDFDVLDYFDLPSLQLLPGSVQRRNFVRGREEDGGQARRGSSGTGWDTFLGHFAAMLCRRVRLFSAVRGGVKMERPLFLCFTGINAH